MRRVHFWTNAHINTEFVGMMVNTFTVAERRTWSRGFIALGEKGPIHNT